MSLRVLRGYIFITWALGITVLFFFDESPFGADIQTYTAGRAQYRIDADVLVVLIVMIDQGRALKMLDTIATTVAIIADFHRYVLTGPALPGPMQNTRIF